MYCIQCGTELTAEARFCTACGKPSASEIPVEAGHTPGVVSGVGHVIEDLRELMPQLLMPLEEIKSFKWLKDVDLLTVAGIGLFPLVCLRLFDDLRSAYWALALYFSLLWAVFLYRQFPSPQVKRKQAVMCFFGTGIVSITLLLFVPHPFRLLEEATRESALPLRFLGMFLGVAILEELCKAAMVFVVVGTAHETLSLQTVLFYGLMSGLGFGIYEGVSYQMGFNLEVTGDPATYYLLNVMRLTSLPFLHAVWTGMAGYFIGLSVIYPRRKRGLVTAAILIPAFLHASHNTFGGLIGFAVDFLSVLALMVYLRQSSVFEDALRGITVLPERH